MATHEDGSGLSLELDADGRKILATWVPAAGRILDLQGVRRAVETRGFGEYHINDEAVGALIKKAGAAAITFSLHIGERRDSSLILTVSDDLMEARLTIKPAFGGQKVTVDAVHQVLAEHMVVFGINEAEIERAVQKGEAASLVIARGETAVDGVDSRFESLIPMKENVPQWSDEEVADFRNLGEIVSVSLGDPLMRRSPPIPGRPGHDLTGRELPAYDGIEIPFAEEMPGVACDLHDHELLVAAISGYPVPLPNGALVEPVFKVKRVDLSTGNLRFKGSLEIAGDVLEGMTVSATEGITVGGLVEAARLEAGGDIEVKGGVIGHGKLTLNSSENRHEAAQLKAGGSVTVQFAENALIEAAGDIQVKELSMQSELTSGRTIRVGEPGGRKGHIIGGLCRAATLVRAIVIGSHAGVPTLIEVGVDPTLNQKLNFVQETLTEKSRLMDELTKTLNYVKENPGRMEPGLLRLKERVYAKYQGEVAELVGEKKRLQKRIEINDQAMVVAERDVFIGVHVRIGSSVMQVTEDYLKPTFRLGPNGIEVESE